MIAPLPIPPKSPRRYDSNTSQRSSHNISPVPALPSPIASSSRAAVSPMYLKQEVRSMSSTSSSSASSGHVSQGYETAPAMLSLKDMPPLASIPLQPVESPSAQLQEISTTSESGLSGSDLHSAQSLGTSISMISRSPVRRHRTRTSEIPVRTSASGPGLSTSPVRPRTPSISSNVASQTSLLSRHGSSRSTRKADALNDSSADDGPDVIATLERAASLHRSNRSPGLRSVVNYPLPSPTGQAPLHNRLSSEPVSRMSASSPRTRHRRNPVDVAVSPRRTPQLESPRRTRTSYLYSETGSPSSSRISSPAGSPRTRTSHATSFGPFEYDSSSNSEGEKLERDFLAAIERRQTSLIDDGDSALRLSLPVTARSMSSTMTGTKKIYIQQESIPPNLIANSRQASRGSVGSSSMASLAISERGVFRGSRYESMSTAADWDSPIVSPPPVAVSPKVCHTF